ncbi:MAG TPA: 2Fe-2S iron-sulfur cluster-binding protein [Alphaproteobacteria bacterium]|nr:2Fe-2S iron-sulfur cluster-binding protein [Alphaproteobacteria bacterium]
MTFTLRIRQEDSTIAVGTGETILAAALAAGVAYPHGCQAGNCGACKSRLHRGTVEMMPYSSYALSAGEKAAGLILACRALPCSDVEVAWLEGDESAIHPWRRLDCRVVALDQLTHDIKRVRLEVLAGGPFVFSAGQYARVAFRGQPARDYSMANGPTEATLEFHIRALADGRSSHYVARHLTLGEEVALEGPFGTSHWRPTHIGPVLAIAGGSGLAPIKSIVETALRHGVAQPIRLYFGVRDERDLYLEEHFAALARHHPNLGFIPVLSEPRRATRRRTGFVHDAVRADHASFAGWKAYLAGPPVMVEAASAMLGACGMAAEDIHADAFYTEAEKAGMPASV